MYVSGGPFTYDATPKSSSITVTGVGGVAVAGSLNVTYNGAAALPTNAGTYAVVALFASSDGNYTDAMGGGTLIINRAMPVVRVSGGPFIYDTTAKSAMGSATGVGGVNVAGTFAFTYNGAANPPVYPGSYAVVASFTSGNPNYRDTTGTGTLAIIGLRDSDQDILVALTKLRDAATRKQDADKLNDAIKHLANGIDPELWLDSIHGTADDGDKIFTETKNAAIAMLAVSNDAIRPLLDQLIKNDRVLALTAVSDAVAHGGNQKNIDKARSELSAGDASAAAGQVEAALEHYRNAWSFATKS